MKEGNINWLLDYFRGKSTDKDESDVVRLFTDENRTEELKDLLSKQFYQLMWEKDTHEKNLDHILYKIHYNINSSDALVRGKKIRSILTLALKVAVIVTLPLLVYLGFRSYSRHIQPDNTLAEIHAPAWTRTSFLLPDGSTVWLNSNSTLKYRMNFRNDRHVELSGEAFFDVVTDAKRPFTVNTSDITIKVHGTKFNVASWGDENTTEIVLENGKIELAAKGSDSSERSFILNPGELALYNHAKKEFTTETVETSKFISWTEGKLVFRNDPLDVVGRRLGRWYNAEVEVSGSFNGNFGLRATFVDESLEEILDILRDNFDINYLIENQGLRPDGTYGKRKVKLIYNEQ